MKSTEYRILKPKQIKAFNVDLPEPAEGEYIIDVTHSQVCGADAKYYFGLRPRYYSLFGFNYLYGVRDKKNFLSKYPIVPLHEAVGVIAESGSNTLLKPGTRVVLIPSMRCENPECEYCSSGRENCCVNSKFMSSNAPGFARTSLILPENCVAEIPPEVPDKIAVYTELATVAYGGIIAADLKKDDRAAVFGDGYMGFILTTLLSQVFGLTKENLWIFGVHDDKLSRLSDFSTTLNIRKQKIPSDCKINKIFECVGKRSAEDVINTSIQQIKPEGTIVLMGVSEEKVPINTRDILSKSLTLRGVSRSPARYYPMVLETMRDRELQKNFEHLTCGNIKIDSTESLQKSFKEFMVNRKKILMKWR